MNQKGSIASAIASAVLGLWKPLREKNPFYLHSINKAIRGARRLGQLPETARPFVTEEVLDLSRKTTALRDIGDLDGLFSAVSEKLAVCGVPEEVLKAARKIVAKSQAPAKSRVVNFDHVRFQRQLDSVREGMVQDLLAQREIIDNRLKRLGYRKGKKTLVRMAAAF